MRGVERVRIKFSLKHFYLSVEIERYRQIYPHLLTKFVTHVTTNTGYCNFRKL